MSNIFTYQYYLFIISVFFFSLSSTVLYGYAFTIHYTAEREDEIAGYTSDLDMSFSAVAKKDMKKITLHFNGKEIRVLKGYGEREKEFYLEGCAIDSGEIVTFTAEDFSTLETLMLEMELDDNNLSKMFLRTLILLHSWPLNLPLLIVMDESKIFLLTQNFNSLVFNRFNFDRKNIGAAFLDVKGTEEFTIAAPSIISICSDINKEHHGRYFRFLWFPFMPLPLWEVVTEVVGGCGRCFGRCGRACLIDGGLLNNEFNRYTQDCFNHDACVCNVGQFEVECTILFVACIDDFYLAPDCGSHFTLTVINGAIQTEPYIGDTIGEFDPLTVITIKADDPPHNYKEFDRWKIIEGCYLNTVGDHRETTTSITMYSNVAVEATYKK